MTKKTGSTDTSTGTTSPQEGPGGDIQKGGAMSHVLPTDPTGIDGDPTD
jgi:hypothetical protein